MARKTNPTSSPAEIALRYMSPRAMELDRLERYVTCRQYEGRVDWFDNASQVPLFERKPCVNYPIAKSAIGSHVDFVLGEGRWPILSCGSSEDDEALDGEWGLDEDQSAALDRFVNVVLVQYARLKEVSREWLDMAMSSRSGAVVVSVQAGQIIAETVRSSWCIPTLDALGEVLSLEIRYPYIDTYYDNERHCWAERCLIYRRVINAVADTVYLPGEGRDDGREPEWVVDASKTRPHGLGFCPVRWYPFLKPCSVTGNVDGRAIHEHQLGEIDCLNVALSQKQRAAVTAGDPQMVETGVSDDVNPAPLGQTATRSLMTNKVDAQGREATIFESVPKRSRGTARKRGAGVIWRYPDKDSRVNYLTIPGDALAAVDDHAKDMRAKLAEAFCAVLIDPGELKTGAAMSGKALAFLFARQIGFDDGVRQNFADRALLPLVSTLLRVVLVVGRKNPAALYVPGVKEIIPILESFERDQTDEAGAVAGKVWMPPRLNPVWGPYFAPNEQDQLFMVQLVTAAMDGGVVTAEQAVEKLSNSGVFEVGSAAEIVKQITEERQAKTAEQADAMHALAAHADGAPPGPTKKPAPKPNAVA